MADRLGRSVQAMVRRPAHALCSTGMRRRTHWRSSATLEMRMASGTLSPSEKTQPLAAGDSLLLGVAVLLVVNVLQRVVGLVRNVGFCHYLPDAQLGAWALTNSFLEIAVPLSLLGLTGGLGRFVEHYRRRSELGDYLRRVIQICAVGLIAVAGWIVVFPRSFQWVVYNQYYGVRLSLLCAAALVALVLYTVVAELVAALRHVRVLSIMQFLQSTLFTVLGLLSLVVWKSWEWLIPSFAVACVLALIPGAWVLMSGHAAEFRASGRLESRSMWRRIVPYAAALWAVNILTGLYESSDRYMLLHLSSATALVGAAAVGQYHCGRILANLLTSVAVMLSGVLLPYLSADWESGGQSRIGYRMRWVLISACVVMLAGSAGALVASPLLFQWLLEGRYALAESVLHLVLLQAVWHGLFLIAESCLLCAERGRDLAVIVGVGLLFNLAGNWWFIPRWGVAGAASATALAAWFCLVCVLAKMRQLDWHPGWGAALLCGLAPLGLLGGAASVVAVLVAIVLVAGRTDWLLTSDDRAEMDALFLPHLHRMGIRLQSLWPTGAKG
ncbi:MAG: lipopolysaccharide biosynthesis protein [Planctomycetota bacterium]|nr:MAG: lipopolysaccharide biosynthesis protein [Planctomycetota bacterium]